VSAIHADGCLHLPVTNDIRMTDSEHLIEQYNRSRDALIRARDRAATGASREFLEQILARVDARIAEVRANMASPMRSLPPVVLARRSGGGVIDALRTFLMAGRRPASRVSRR
jgi:hypothetical protein